MGRGGGRGGVIAGAPLRSEIGKISGMHIDMPSGQVCESIGAPTVTGRLTVETAGKSYTMDNVDCDILAAAKRLVFDDIGIRKWQPGEALGLASIDVDDFTKTFPYYLPADGSLHKIGWKRAMLLHPALVDLSVGRSIAYLDLWPGTPLPLLRATAENRQVARWLKSMAMTATWKWSDSPARITAKYSSLQVIPLNGKHLLGLRTFTKEDMRKESLACDPIAGSEEKCQQFIENSNFGIKSKAFDQVSDVLISKVPDFAKAEQLLRVLTVFRLARKDGLKQVKGNIDLAYPRSRTPNQIVQGIYGDYIAGVFENTRWETDCHTFAARYVSAKESLIKTSADEEKDALLMQLQRLELGWFLEKLASRNAEGKVIFRCTPP